MLGTITLTPYKGLVMVFTDGDHHLLRRVQANRNGKIAENLLSDLRNCATCVAIRAPSTNDF
jgi:hypothetical protein